MVTSENKRQNPTVWDHLHCNHVMLGLSVCVGRHVIDMITICYDCCEHLVNRLTQALKTMTDNSAL